MENNVFKKDYKASSCTLRLIRENIKGYLAAISVDVNDISTIVIAINEACMNIIQHANHGHYKGNISIGIKRELAGLVIEISDDAESEHYLKVKPVERTELKPGGLGLHIINEIMDCVEHIHKDNSDGNKLIMKKTLRK